MAAMASGQRWQHMYELLMFINSFQAVEGEVFRGGGVFGRDRRQMMVMVVIVSCVSDETFGERGSKAVVMFFNRR